MSEPKGPFDTSLTVLRYGIGDGEDFEAAIRVLEDWPKWEPLIEAAGGVDKNEALETITYFERYGGYDRKRAFQIRAFLEALPDKE